MADDLYATLHTNFGPIVIKLFPNHAPKTVRNFVGLAEGSIDWTHPRTGESVAVNGACMTVIAAHPAWFVFEAGPESLARTTLGQLSPGLASGLAECIGALAG